MSSLFYGLLKKRASISEYVRRAIKKKVGQSLMIRLHQSLRCVSCFISFRKKRPITIQHVNITVTSFILVSVHNFEKYFLKEYLIIPQKEMICKTMFGVCT